jgi:peptidoglycan/LPS O-acetylase OafA/YrhL
MTSSLAAQHAHARLDVARGLAALAVFFAHISEVFFWRLLGENHPVAIVAAIVARHAVLIFFLLSGHLITRSIILNIRRNGCFDVQDYLTSRVARIYPPLIGAVAVCLAVWCVIHFFDLPGAVTYAVPGDLYRVRDDFGIRPGDIFGALTMTGGLLNANGPLWSLFIEFQIYIVAMGIAVFWREGIWIKAAAIIPAMAAVWLLRHQVFFVAVWALGAATTVTWRHAPRRATLAALVALVPLAFVLFVKPALFHDMGSKSGLLLQLLCCLPYCAILFFLPPKLRYPKALIATGNFSYSLYVVHFPLLMLALSLTQGWIGRSYGRTWLSGVVAALCVAGFSVLFAKVTEQQAKFKKLAQAGISRFQRLAAPGAGVRLP